jgi:hypothetical protein
MSHIKLWSSCGCLSFIALLAGCSNDTVNLGGGRAPHELQPGERCSGSSIVQGPITVHDQQELTELAGCEEIDGDLHIEIFHAADLSPLSALHIVDGALEIGAYPDAANEESADLAAIQAEVDDIVRNGYLSSLTGLEGLVRASNLQISYVSAEDLEPLRGLSQLGGRDSGLPVGSVYVENNPNLRGLQALSSIESVRELVVVDNPALTSLGGIKLSERAGNINLVDNPLLSSLDELEAVGSADTLILSNLGISDLDSLFNLGYVDDVLDLDGNSLLRNMDGLARLYGAGSLTVTNNAVLQSVPSLQGMGFSLDKLMVTRNPALQSLHIDLPPRGEGVDYLRGSPAPNPITLIDIGQNDNLTELSLSAGVERGRLAAIYENPSLVQLSIGTLQSLEELDITGNANLANVDVGALRTVERLSVTNNPKLDPAQLGTVRTFDALVGRNAKPPTAAP